MTVAIVNVCIDPRLDHESIRGQARVRLERLGLRADRVFVTNEPGGNAGSALRGAIELVGRQREAIVLAAVLHHDDCIAASEGMRRPLAESGRALGELLKTRDPRAVVLTGSVFTQSGAIVWTDEPSKSLERFPFRMPSMLGR